jgi:hypothetical protein
MLVGMGGAPGEDGDKYPPFTTVGEKWGKSKKFGSPTLKSVAPLSLVGLIFVTQV